MSLKTLTWIHAQVLTFTETFPPPDPSRFRDAIKSLSHTLEITSLFNQGWEPSTLKGRYWHKSWAFRVCTIPFLKLLSSPQGQTSTYAADNRLTNPKALTHTKKGKGKTKQNTQQKKPTPKYTYHKSIQSTLPYTQISTSPLHHHSFKSVAALT